MFLRKMLMLYFLRTLRMKLKAYIFIHGLLSILVMMILLVLLKNKENLQLSSLQFHSSNSLWMRSMEMKYHKTNEMVYKICREYNEPVRSEIYRDFLMADLNHKLASCLHAKVGSTTWSNYFYAILPNETKNELEHKFGNASKRLFKQDIIRPHYRLPNDIITNVTINQLTGVTDDLISIKELEKLLKTKNVLTFSFVRHPFERLVSAFQDRILQRNILHEYGYSTWFYKNHSFPSFVNLVLKEYKQFNCSRIHDSECPNINIHWKSFASECSYCNIKYDVIGRMETFDEDVKYIMKKSNLESIFSMKSIKKLHSSKHKSNKMTQKYFSQLTKGQVNELYNMYKMDFEMFGYDAKNYFPK